MRDKRFNIDDDADLQKFLQSVDCVPPAPDCRSAVRSKIENAHRSTRPWLYALGFVPAAVLALAIVMALRQSPMESRIVIAPRPPVTSEQTDRVATPPFALQVKLKEQPPEVTRPTPREDASDKATLEPRREKPKKQLPATDRKPLPMKLHADACEENVTVDVPVSQKEEEKTLAIVAVTRPSAEELARDECDFNYTECDSETGEVIQCSGRRSGNSIMVCVNVE